MDKYAVVIDPKKVPEKEKKGEAGNKVEHPDTNVPIDPVKGTEPFEKQSEEK